MLYSPQPPSVPSAGALTIRPFRRTGLILAGEADCTTRNKLHTALATLPADGTGEIHLDLTELRFIDVCCTRELIALSERYPGVRLIVHCPPATLRRITAILDRKDQVEFVEAPMPGIGGLNAGRHDPGLPVPAAARQALLPDIVELIQAEHARISKLIENLDSAPMDAGPADRGPGPELAWAALAGFLRFHVDAAAEIAYQALASAGPEAALAIRKASEADADIRAAMEEARLSRPGSRAWHLAVEAVSSAAKTHIACVESGPLARYQHHTAPEPRRALGRQWVAFMAAQVLDATAIPYRARHAHDSAADDVID